jgi:hypothetical protein
VLLNIKFLPHHPENRTYSTMAVPSLPAGKGPSQKSKAVKKASKPTSSTATSFQSQLVSLESSLSTSSDLNPLYDLIQLLNEKTSKKLSEADVVTSQRGIKFLVRSLQTLLNDKRIPLTQVNEQGLVQGSFRDESTQTEADKAVANWLRQRWNESTELFCLLLSSEEGSIRVSTSVLNRFSSDSLLFTTSIFSFSCWLYPRSCHCRETHHPSYLSNSQHMKVM